MSHSAPSSSGFAAALALAASVFGSELAPCPADVDDDPADRDVGFADLLVLLQSWGPCPADPEPCPADLSGNGDVAFVDLLLLLESWGPCPGSPAFTFGPLQVEHPQITDGCTSDLDVTLSNTGDAPAFEAIEIAVLLSEDGESGPDDAVLATTTLDFESDPFDPCEIMALSFPEVLIPEGTPWSAYQVLACVTGAEPAACASAAIEVSEPDAAIIGVDVDSAPIVTGTVAPVLVELSNDDCEAVTVLLHAQVPGDQDSVWCTIPAYGTTVCTLLIEAPSVPPSCGSVSSFTVTVSMDYGDRDASNNTATTTLAVLPLYWDLDFEIINASSSAPSTSCSADWQVRVRNEGTVPSPQRCGRTGICRYCLDGDWLTWCFVPAEFNIPPLQPGQSYTYTVNNFCITNALFGTQYIRAGIDTFHGCTDPCGGGNFDCRSITIY